VFWICFKIFLEFRVIIQVMHLACILKNILDEVFGHQESTE